MIIYASEKSSTKIENKD